MSLIEDGIVIVLSSPSGAGKTTLVNKISKKKNFQISISYTTRIPRDNEVNGSDYYFIKKSEFKELIDQDELLEYAEVFDNFYGSSKSKVQNFIKNKKNVLFDIDWQGTQQIRKKIDKKNLITFFILPPSKKTLINRLSERENNNKNIVKQRMAKFESDVTNWIDYDYVVINDNLEICLEEILNVIDLKINDKEIIFDKVKIEKHIQSLIS
tara:strand:+ start:1951 stop:2583 length:633 start_codon:yes stop_codon:yes gene_type:complete